MQLPAHAQPFLFMTLALLAMVLSAAYIMPDPQNQLARIKSLKENVKDPIEFLYQYEVIRSATDQYNRRFIYTFPVIVLGAVLLGSLIHSGSNKMPAYNFYWGDYEQVYNRQIGWIKFFFVTVILGLVIGVLGNYIYSALVH
jgi:hypothetical protein